MSSQHAACSMKHATWSHLSTSSLRWESSNNALTYLPLFINTSIWIYALFVVAVVAAAAIVVVIAIVVVVAFVVWNCRNLSAFARQLHAANWQLLI